MNFTDRALAVLGGLAGGIIATFIAVASADGTEVAATAFPGGSEDAVDALGDASYIALMAPPVALAAANILAETAETVRLFGDAENLDDHLALADAILGGTA